MEKPKTNTGAHEQMISDAAKDIAAGALNISVAILNTAVDKLKISPDDPLTAEKFVHLADQLTAIAHRMYEIGERSRETSVALYNQGRAFPEAA